jgi:uncharacterized membrane protein YfcA
LEANCYIGTSAAIDFGVDLSRFIIYYTSGFWDQEFIPFIPLLLIASVAGTYIGKLIVGRYKQQTFRRIVLVFIGFTGFYMLLSYLI